MGFLIPKIPTVTPPITPAVPGPRTSVKAEAGAAKRDLEERMRRASINRQKSVLKTPELASSVDDFRQGTTKLFSKNLG